MAEGAELVTERSSRAAEKGITFCKQTLGGGGGLRGVASFFYWTQVSEHAPVTEATAHASHASARAAGDASAGTTIQTRKRKSTEGSPRCSRSAVEYSMIFANTVLLMCWQTAM